jgi:hypothetical protein
MSKAMNVFLIHVDDDNFYRLLPEALDRSKSENGRIKVMASVFGDSPERST